MIIKPLTLTLKRDLRESLENHIRYDYSCFQNIFVALLNKHAPVKKKIMRFNDNLFMSKALRKAIMHRSKFKNMINTEQKTTGKITKSKESFV